MERGPLPPHERSWRHPSELAAEQRELALAERSPRGTRLTALASGTVGLLALGLLMVTVTPGRVDSPIAISSSTTPATFSSEGRATIAVRADGPEVMALRSDTSIAGPDVIATPIGDGSFAVVTRASVANERSAIIDVRLPSGGSSLGSIVMASDDTVIVALATAEAGHPIAARRPNADDLVTVMASPPLTVAFDDVDTLAVAEGTPVMDDEGQLVGLCSRHGESGTRVIELSEEIDDATSVVP